MSLLGDLLADFPAYSGKFFRIADKSGREIQWTPSPAQRRLNASLRRQLNANKPVRLRVLKFRQAMVSTWATALMQWLSSTSTGCTAISIADKKDLPAQWLRRCERWHNQIPTQTQDNGRVVHLRPELSASNAIEMYYGELGSRYYIASAEGTTPGMGATIRGIHCSEIASWGDPDILLNDLLPAVPPGPGTIIIQESTGRARGDWWYQRYMASKRGDEGYEALFLPWYIQPEYTESAADILSFTVYERWLVSQGAQPGQVAWRRRMIRDEFHGDEAAFANQYPATEEEAFLAAGRNLFNSDHVAAARSTVRAPKWRGFIAPRDDPSQYELIGADGGPLLIFDHDPAKGEKPQGDWGIGADCRDSGEDYDAAYSERCFSGELGFAYCGRVNTGDWARQLAALGYYYNRARLAAEKNASCGKQVRLALLGMAGNTWRYPNLYVGSKEEKFAHLSPDDYGFLTDHNSKAMLIAVTMQELAYKPPMDWGDELAVGELESIVVPENGNPGAPEGQHDDRWMARMIAKAAARQEVRYKQVAAPVQAEAPIGTYQAMKDRQEAERKKLDLW